VIDIVRLHDPASGVEISIVPAIGNMAYEMKVKGRNILWFPFESLEAFRDAPSFCGIPFLGPWANRIDGDAYWINGNRYLLNPELGNVRRDGNGLPIHGLLSFSPLWRVVDRGPAHVSSRIEFWRYPELMAQFPFAHNLTMTHRLSGGELEVETVVENLATQPMPIAVGYHPYFRLHDTPRDGWKASLSARGHLTLDHRLLPTGEVRPAAFGDPHSLDGSQLDDVLTDLVRDSDGRARFHVHGGNQRVTVAYGPKYTTAVVYAPAAGDFICFEPMSAATNAFNRAHRGLCPDLQSVPAGGVWRESFWISASGF
jgi:aldose 1-epimerase